MKPKVTDTQRLNALQELFDKRDESYTVRDGVRVVAVVVSCEPFSLRRIADALMAGGMKLRTSAPSPAPEAQR